jgi:predicted DNA-binding antitoxin AbrB/MazE fold protein
VTSCAYNVVMEIQGHYQNGMIVPHNDVPLPDGTEVIITVREQSTDNSKAMTQEERRRYLAALARIDALPDENPGDTFSGADHDQVLYGNGA